MRKEVKAGLGGIGIALATFAGCSPSDPEIEIPSVLNCSESPYSVAKTNRYLSLGMELIIPGANNKDFILYPKVDNDINTLTAEIKDKKTNESTPRHSDGEGKLRVMDMIMKPEYYHVQGKSTVYDVYATPTIHGGAVVTLFEYCNDRSKQTPQTQK